jgi:hypothetical protein
VKDRKSENPDEIIVCDRCGNAVALGAYFVPGKGVLNLCGHCRIVLKAVLVDVAQRRANWKG